MSDYETYLVYAWFVELLRHFLRARPMARMIALEMGFRLALPDKTVIRKPDLGVVRDDNPQPLRPREASYRGVFDLCIEALSVTERRGIERDTVTKKAEYAAGGVPEYYILHPAPEHQAFFTRTPAGVYVPLPRRRPGRKPSGHWLSCGRNWRRGKRTDPPPPSLDETPAPRPLCDDPAER